MSRESSAVAYFDGVFTQRALELIRSSQAVDQTRRGVRPAPKRVVGRYMKLDRGPSGAALLLEQRSGRGLRALCERHGLSLKQVRYRLELARKAEGTAEQ